MTGKPYGRTSRPRQPKAPTQPQLAEGEILIAIHGRHTLEQLARELQIAIARLHDGGAYGVEKFRIRLEPRDSKGQPVILRNRDSEQIRVIQIPEPEAKPPYRPGPYGAPTSAASPKPAMPAAPRSPHTGRFNKL